LAGAFIVLWPAIIVWGEDKLPVGGPSPTADMTSAVLKMLASLALIIGIIIVSFYLLKRLKGFRARVNEGPAITIVGSLPIAPKRSVTVVEVGGRWLVLGVGTESVRLLYTMEPCQGQRSNGQSKCEPEGTFERVLRRVKPFSNKGFRGKEDQ